ncbi:MAG: insulinase family protein, partial [Spirochaetota bacterium]
MNMQVNSVYTGFMLKEETFIKEINATGRLFEHHRSGARLVSLACEDDNKVFSIGFRTPPEDNTGIPHILEHSVLCGSRKFPSKEPFVELVKGSLNTFLNAMTFSDKTLYPVASKNEKDFYNLMDVYLDAVFYPRIYQDPDIFMQEGWHYEMDSPESDIRYRGVVYSEMQGVFSTPEALLFRKIPQSLLPDTPYGYESGGDPEAIPELTYQKFISYHKKYYHPSNSYIFLYGNGDLFQQLEFIHENYLKDFSRIEVNSTISRQEPFASPVEMSLEYPISPHEPDQDRT